MPESKNQQRDIETPHSPYKMKSVQLIKDSYRTCLQLNYNKRWELVWPPKDTGHTTINKAFCEELGLHPAVI
ncbi:hypothetical protein BDW75DRAFT_220248 [Aspergillus navahoensis]